LAFLPSDKAGRHLSDNTYSKNDNFHDPARQASPRLKIKRILPIVKLKEYQHGVVIQLI
jgi:hypothetical protein